jgi:O-antigen/teichoic acid export membrane protein
MFAPLLVASLILPLSGLLRASQAALRGLQRLLSGQVAEIVVQPGAMLLLVAGATLLAPAALDPAAAVGLHLASLGVALLAGAWLLRRHLPGGATKAASSWRHDEWIRGAVYLMLIGGLHILNSRIDIVMLGSLATAKETGVYTICARGADLAMFLALPVHTALMPLAAKLHAAARLAELQLVAARSARAIFVLSFPLVAVLATFGDRFLLLYGEDYAVGARALAILCLGKLALLAAGPAALLLTMTGFERSAALGVGASAALNIVLNSFTIPALGMEGAAVATAISAVTLAGFMTLLVRRNLAIRPDILGRRRSAPGD